MMKCPELTPLECDADKCVGAGCSIYRKANGISNDKRDLDTRSVLEIALGVQRRSNNEQNIYQNQTG